MTAGHRSRTSTAALVIALIALFVALDGPSYAQKLVQSIDGHAIKNGTIDANRLSRSARRALTGKAGPRGRQGPGGSPGQPGTPGAPGPAGTAVAYARINMIGGSVTLEASKNITQDQVSAATGHPGIVCFHDLNFTVHSMVASPEIVSVDPTQQRVFVAVESNASAAGCPSTSPPFDHSAILSAWDATTASPDSHEVIVWFQ
jgi:hypothetical protein